MKKLEENKDPHKQEYLLKKSSLGRRGINPLFTYAVKKGTSSITLQQQETGFFITLEWEKLEDTLRITRFKVFQNPDLKRLSLNLYEAATLDIVFQKIELLFSYAKYHKLNEILFLLPIEETFHEIDCFKNLFGKVTPLTWKDEKRMTFTLSCFSEDFFFEQIENIKVQIDHELWQAQAYDSYLRDYLQSHPKGTPLFTEPLIDQEEKTLENKASVILFPKLSRL